MHSVPVSVHHHRVLRAFTLVELIAVTIVLAILGLGLARRIADRQPAIQAAQQHRQIALLIRQTHDLATTTGRRHWMNFDSANPTITVVAEASPGAGFSTATSVLHPVTRQPLSAPTPPSTASFAHRPLNNTLGFNHLGRPIYTNGNPYPLTFSITFSGQTLSIHPSTGRVSIVP